MRARLQKKISKKDSIDEKRLNEVYKKYHETVNMGASELKAWSETEYSKLASQDRSPIQRNLRLLSKKKSEWTNKDIEDANKTIAFVSRMKKAEQGEPAKKGAPSKRDISLKNWAFDPNKKSDIIRQKGNKHQVLSESGEKLLGEYNTKSEAMSRLKQIEHFENNQKDSRRNDAVYRIDRLGYIHTEQGRKDGIYAELTPEGFLRCRGKIARTGPQLYFDQSGEEWVEYRPEDEVFKPESMKSFSMAILTDDHPPVMVSSENVEELQKGFLGSEISRDGKYLVADILITDKDLIAKILRGDKVELSCGYFTTVIDREGVCPETGTSYTKVQTDIEGNHVAVVEEGRAGPECRLYMDSAFSNDLKGIKNTMKRKDAGKLQLGDKEYEISDDQMKMIMELLAPKPEGEVSSDEELESKDMEEMDMEMEEEKESMDEEEEKEKMSMDALKAKVDFLTAQVKAQKDSRHIDARVNLIADAKAIVPGIKTDGASDVALMSAVVKAVTPSMDLKGKSRDYVKAAYDMALVAHKKNTDSNKELFGLIANADSVGGSADSKLDALRAKMYGGKN